jgi:hypothetical protein
MQKLIQFFEYKHLPEHLQTVSKEFNFLAHSMLTLLPENEESTVAMRKLLEAKDCAVRSTLYKEPYEIYKKDFFMV